MKKRLLLFITLLIGYVSFSQIVDIPDANFKYALVHYEVADLGNPDLEDVDTNNDGEIQVSEAEAVIGLWVHNLNIDSIEGIQYFINMIHFDCGGNNLTDISIDQISGLVYLACDQNQLTNLDVTHNPNLEWLRCEYNQISGLDVSQNSILYSLVCFSNQLTSLDITQNQNLWRLNIISNQITNLDVTQNPNLEKLYCSNNQLTSLDVSLNSILKEMWCSDNQIIGLDVTQNPDLVRLHCDNNFISTLDFTQNPNLWWLTCTNNVLNNLHMNNGNNSNMIAMYSFDNPNLICIQVDDETATYPVCDTYEMTGWCVDPWSEYSEECDLGFTDQQIKLDVVIYPNPIQNLLTIYNTSNTEITSIKLYDVLGRLILAEEGNVSEIDVSHLNSGVLFVEIETDNGVVTKKIIKK